MNEMFEIFPYIPNLKYLDTIGSSFVITTKPLRKKIGEAIPQLGFVSLLVVKSIFKSYQEKINDDNNNNNNKNNNNNNINNNNNNNL